MKITLMLALLVVVLLVSVFVEGRRGHRQNRWKPRPRPDCSLALDTGRQECSRSPVERFYFNTETSKCEAFQFTGCGGNSNNFFNLRLCQLRCERKRPVTRVTTTTVPDDDDSVPPA